MERYYDYDAILRDVSHALEQAIETHGLGLFHPVAMCAVIEAIASPLKGQVAGPLLMHKVGKLGVELYYASRAPRLVEVLKAPHSLIVNPLMDAIVLALLKKGPLPEARLFRETLKVHLDLSGRPKSEIDQAIREHANLEPAFASALDYLLEGQVMRASEDGAAWELLL